MQITESRSVAVSYIRAAALISIVTCHLMQASNNRWAWILNIGVQVFFFISGYLYGHKDISNWLLWFKQRLCKIYMPCLIVALISIATLGLITETNISPSQIIAYCTNTQWFMGNVHGIDHLWFITAIFLCYLTTPLLQSLKTKSNFFAFLITIYALYEIVYIRYDVNVFISLYLYSMGYFWGNIKEHFRYVLLMIYVLGFIVILLNISWSNILEYHGIMNQLFHSWGGICLCIVVIELMSVLNFKKICKAIKLLNNYSYEVYLIHHPFIIGPLSLIKITDNYFLNICIILSIVCILSILFKSTYQIINNRLCTHI